MFRYRRQYTRLLLLCVTTFLSYGPSSVISRLSLVASRVTLRPTSTPLKGTSTVTPQSAAPVTESSGLGSCHGSCLLKLFLDGLFCYSVLHESPDFLRRRLTHCVSTHSSRGPPGMVLGRS